MTFNVENEPNAGRLIDSMRNLGYGNYEAIADLVDNSLDAEASNIWITCGISSGKPIITLSDDGIGMDMGTLDQSMRLGSLTERSANSDLGRFGMGLVTASLSLAPSCRVYTKQDTSEILVSAWDVDEVKRQEKFVKRLENAELKEISMLPQEFVNAKTGTTVILERCDQIRNSNMSVFSKILATHLGRVHRHFLQAGKKIFINGSLIKAIDPLMLDHKDTEIDIDLEMPIKIKRDSGEVVENIRIRIAIVPPRDACEHDIAIGIKNQGFYLMRNQREIMAAQTLDCFTKHNSFNQMRGEIFFPGSLDDVFGIEFTKRQTDIQQSVFDQIASVLRLNCSRIKRTVTNKYKLDESEVTRAHHDQAVKTISEKEKLLLKPPAKIEQRQEKQKEGSVKPTDSGQKRENIKNSKEVARKLNCEFSEERMGPSGQIYECEMKGTTIHIRYNIEHPFFQRFILENTSEARMVSATDFLIYCMASSELRFQAEDEAMYDVISTFKFELSSNLRTLLN